MEKYRLTLNVIVKEDWASLSDFEREIEQFNLANKGVMEAEIRDVKLVKREAL